MEINMVLVVLALFIILLITRVITLETFKMNLATLTLFIIMIMLLFSSLSVQYINGSNQRNHKNSIPISSIPSTQVSLPKTRLVSGPSSNIKFF